MIVSIPIAYDQMENVKLLSKLYPDQQYSYISSVEDLRPALDYRTIPSYRLKVGCIGKNMRDDPFEDGLSNGTKALLEIFTRIPAVN